MEKVRLAQTFHTPVAAGVSRRHYRRGQSAPTDVGGYRLLANHAKCELSEPAYPKRRASSCEFSQHLVQMGQ